MKDVARRVGGFADWAERTRPRRPKIEVAGRPPWVGRAVSEALPALALLAVVGLVQLLDSQGLWLAFTAACCAYLAVFFLLPWSVLVARRFVAGYRGEGSR